MEQYEVKTIATETTAVIVKGEEQLDVMTILCKIANDLDTIKKELGK